MIKWIKKLLYIVANFNIIIHAMEQSIQNAETIAETAESVIRERTAIHADVHVKGQNHIIMVGQYNKHSYIQTFTFPPVEFSHLIDQLKHMKKHGIIDCIDAPPQMNYIFDKELY